MPIKKKKTQQKEALISFENVSFHYGERTILENVTFQVEKGDFMGIIGPNGSGKTTVLKTMLGLLKPTSGVVRLCGEEIGQFKHWSRIGYIPQKVTQLNSRFPITVEEVVSLGRVGAQGLFRALTKEDFKKIHESLSVVGMEKFKKSIITKLSGGQQQRVFIAKALAGDPDLLVLDEPTVGVDSESQESFYELLAQLNKEHGLTVVLVSHDIDVVVNEVTTLLGINKKVIYHGVPKTFMKEDYLERLYGHRHLILHNH